MPLLITDTAFRKLLTKPGGTTGADLAKALGRTNVMNYGNLRAALETDTHEIWKRRVGSETYYMLKRRAPLPAANDSKPPRKSAAKSRKSRKPIAPAPMPEEPAKTA